MICFVIRAHQIFVPMATVLCLLGLASTAHVSAHNWTYVRGALAAGNDIEQKTCTVKEAEAFCAQ